MVRGRRRLDPLCEGVLSRIYMAAYPKPRTSYEVAKLILPGSEPCSSSGRILRTALSRKDLFKFKREDVSPFRVRVLITSRVEPFLERLTEGCELEHGELEALKGYLEGGFRKVAGIYLQTVLEKRRTYLASNVNAFEELLSILAVTLRLAKVHLSPHTPAREVVLKIAAEALPGFFRGGRSQPLEEIAESLRPPLINKLYRHLLLKMPLNCLMPVAALEGIEKAALEMEKNPEICRCLEELQAKTSLDQR